MAMAWAIGKAVARDIGARRRAKENRDLDRLMSEPDFAEKWRNDAAFRKKLLGYSAVQERILADPKVRKELLADPRIRKKLKRRWFRRLPPNMRRALQETATEQTE